MVPDRPVPAPPPTTPVEPRRFLRRPLEVEAVQVTPSNARAVAAWCDGQLTDDGRHVVVACYDGKPRIAGPMDWVTVNRSHDGEQRRLGVSRAFDFSQRFVHADCPSVCATPGGAG